MNETLESPIQAKPTKANELTATLLPRRLGCPRSRNGTRVSKTRMA